MTKLNKLRTLAAKAAGRPLGPHEMPMITRDLNGNSWLVRPAVTTHNMDETADRLGMRVTSFGGYVSVEK